MIEIHEDSSQAWTLPLRKRGPIGPL